MQATAESELYDEAVGPVPEPKAHPGRIQEMPDKRKFTPVYYRADHQWRCPNVPSAGEWKSGRRARRVPESDEFVVKYSTWTEPAPTRLEHTSNGPLAVAPWEPARRELRPRSNRLIEAEMSWAESKRRHAEGAAKLAELKDALGRDPENESVALMVMFVRLTCLRLADEMIEKRNEVRRLGGDAR